MEECRTCGIKITEENINLKLQSEIDYVSFKEFIEYFCQIKLDEDPKLPQGCCKTCCNTILKFCLFVVNVEKVQNKFKNRLPLDNGESSRHIFIPSGMSNSLKQSNKETSTQNDKRSLEVVKRKLENDESDGELKSTRKSKRKKNNEILNQALQDIKNVDKRERFDTTLCESLLEVQELFNDDLEEKEIGFKKISIKSSLLDKDTGEVPISWLRNYNDSKIWQDFTYICTSHCQKKIKTLKALLDHYDEHKVSHKRRVFSCVVCHKTYSTQSTNFILYLNHMGLHYPHLKFTCILCDKVFVNVVKLTQHMIAEHATRKLRIFPCFDCGLNFPNLEKLSTHKRHHDGSNNPGSKIFSMFGE